MTRESLLVSTIVELADSLVDNFDVIDVLTLLSDRCVLAVDVDAAGVMLISPGGEPQYIASSSESMRLLELFQIQVNEGPCVDCIRTGKPIINHSISEGDDHWPRFSPKALEQGYQSVHCMPLRLRGRTIGALNLFRTHQGPLEEQDILVAQGLADVATIAILQHRSTLDSTVLNQQLSSALHSRIVIEQAKGIISQSATCDMDVAFARLRAHARNKNLGLTLVALRVVEGDLHVTDLDYPKTK